MLVRKRFLALALLALCALNLLILRSLLSADTLEISVLPVGSGQAVLMRSPDGRTYLVNAGGDASVLRALGTALPFWKRRIDALILTDGFAKESGGGPAVLARYRVGVLLRSGAQASAIIDTALADSRVASRELVRGMRLMLDGGAYADVLSPPGSSPSQPLLLRIGYGSSSVLIGELPARVSAWEARADARLPEPDLVLSSTTLPSAYELDGTRIIHK